MHHPSRLAPLAALLALLPAAALAQTPPKLVDVKTATGVSRLSTDVNGALLAGGEFDGDPFLSKAPQEGAGTRLMWYPAKAAFRAGYVDGTQWDAANTGNYSTALGYDVRAAGDYSTALGFQATAVQTGSTAIGQYCTASGAASVALGNYAHTNSRQGSFVFADRSVVDDGNSLTDEAFRAGVNHSANWRVSGGFRIYSSSNLSTGVTIQSGATTSNWGQVNTVISTSTGAYLSTGGIWTNTSDRHKKHLFEPVSGEDVLARLRRVPLTSWSYKADPARIRHLGPMAQDFRKAFGLGQDSISIGTVDADGVALAGVQALDARSLGQARLLATLQAENQALRHRLDALEHPAAAVAASRSGLSLPMAALLLLGTGLGAVLLRRR